MKKFSLHSMVAVSLLLSTLPFQIHANENKGLTGAIQSSGNFLEKIGSTYKSLAIGTVLFAGTIGGYKIYKLGSNCAEYYIWGGKKDLESKLAAKNKEFEQLSKQSDSYKRELSATDNVLSDVIGHLNKTLQENQKLEATLQETSNAKTEALSSAHKISQELSTVSRAHKLLQGAMKKQNTEYQSLKTRHNELTQKQAAQQADMEATMRIATAVANGQLQKTFNTILQKPANAQSSKNSSTSRVRTRAIRGSLTANANTTPRKKNI